MTLSLYGLREWLGATVVCAGLSIIAFAMGMSWLVPLILLIWIALLLFFRDPLGRKPESMLEEDLVCPADGHISAVERLEDHEAIGGPAVVVRIFLSVLDVHINRAPCCGTVRELRYRPGQHLDARSEESARVNESNLIMMTRDDGTPIGIRQVSGAIARRIVCPLKPGDRLTRAARFGMIKFGSTTELIVPDRGPERTIVHVAKGDRVRGAINTLVTLHDEA
ncbi:MAG TPA: phosphatidylserine decarboxylase family protein [Phycisphaerales bacterium]|nr:phosphatidylserine decarboxylase family protein [Phycisphaerales bacterium]